MLSICFHSIVVKSFFFFSLEFFFIYYWALYITIDNNINRIDKLNLFGLFLSEFSHFVVILSTCVFSWRREYFRKSRSPTSSIASSALSSISLVCEALKQKRTLDSVRRVAGKPTVTTAIPLLSISWLKALWFEIKIQINAKNL